MNYLIVENGIITNIIIADHDFVATTGVMPHYEGAGIGLAYNPPFDIEQLRVDMLSGLEGMCSGTIYAGTMVTCSADRGKKHYSFPVEAQRAITLMAQGTALGTLAFSYKADNEEYNPYTAEEVKVLFKALGDWITANTKYKETLEKWISQETDVAILRAIRYGSTPPKALLDDLTAYLTQLGVDATGLVGLLNSPVTT